MGKRLTEEKVAVVVVVVRVVEEVAGSWWRGTINNTEMVGKEDWDNS